MAGAYDGLAALLHASRETPNRARARAAQERGRRAIGADASASERVREKRFLEW